MAGIDRRAILAQIHEKIEAVMAREFIRKSRRQNLRIISNAYNGFAVSTAEDFLALLQALAGSGPNAPEPKPIEKFLATHPKAVKAITAPKPTPVSFATEPYFGVNAFLFTNCDGKARFSVTF